MVALSKIFNVTIEELNSGNFIESTEALTPKEMKNRINPAEKLGIGLCIMGAFCVIVFGVIMIAFPSSADKLNQSSVITVNGSGIVLLVFVAAMVIGILLITKNMRR